jgi:hypothetical protein
MTAPWDARVGHTSVADAAGAIYVIGGIYSSYKFYSDVWKGTDGGADRTRAGYARGTREYLRGTKGVQRGTIGVPRSTKCSRDIQG